ncbi:MAG: metallophosphoesterase, partial [Pseudomonadota bacterium]|nr:metallophosphoesterase [Pseudomonadota bacterium]
LSDCHLMADPMAQYKGVNPYARLSALLDQIMTEHGDTDALLITGDLSQDDSLESYGLLKQLLDKTGFSYHWLMGNHDLSRRTINEAFPTISLAPEHFELRARQENNQTWQILLLDSRFSGHVEGRLAPQQMAWLEQRLKTQQESVVFLHHPVTDTASPEMNAHRLVDADHFAQIVEQNAHLRAIFHGHVHREMHLDLHGTPVYASPATSYQYQPDFALDQQPPGYRVISLGDQVHTWVERLD